MAQNTITRYLDDLDLAEGHETDADEKVTIGFNGQWWELDLSETHFLDLSQFLLPFLQAGRKPSNGTRRSRPRNEPSGTNSGKNYDTRPRSYYTGLRGWLSGKGINYDSCNAARKAEHKREYDDYLNDGGVRQ